MYSITYNICNTINNNYYCKIYVHAACIFIYISYFYY